MAAVRAAVDIGPKVKVEMMPGVFRIPDGLTDDVLSEVKNVKALSYTQQLRDYAAFASQTDRQFNLYVRPGARPSIPLLNAQDAGEAVIKEIPFK